MAAVDDSGSEACHGADCGDGTEDILLSASWIWGPILQM